MSIGKIDQDILRIKKEFSEISPGKTSRAEPVQKKKGSSPIVIGTAVIVIIIALVVLALYVL